MRKEKIKKTKYKYFLPNVLYRRIIKKYCVIDSSKIRIYNSFLQFIDSSLLIHNRELLSKLLVLKKEKKTLTEIDLIAFKQIARMYNPRDKVELDSERVINLKSRIKKLADPSQKLRMNLSGWLFLSDMIYQEVEYLGLKIEGYLIKTKKASLTHKDIPSLFFNSTDFLL